MAKELRGRPAVAGVASAERTLQVLAAFRDGDGTLELADLAKRTGLVKSTIMRLAVSLEQYGFLVRNLDGSYVLGGEIVRLAGIYGAKHDLSEDILPVLEFLARESQETATFWVREGNHRRCLYRVNSPLQLRLEIPPGTLRLMDSSSSASVLRNFGALNPGADSAEPLPYYTAGVTTPHVASLSVPVFGQNSQLMGALALSGPDSRLNQDRAREVGRLLLQVSRDLTRRLGGRIDAIPAETPVTLASRIAAPKAETGTSSPAAPAAKSPSVDQALSNG